MKQVTAKELQTLDPKGFDKAYYHWCSHGPYDDWDEWLIDSFKCDMHVVGVRVERVHYNSRPGLAQFDGHVDITQFMRCLRLDEKYPALALAVQSDGSYVSVREGRYGNSYSLSEELYYTTPSGIFTYLDQDAWEGLVYEQLLEADIESDIEEFCTDKCRELAKAMEKEYDDLTSVEAFIESCECNEITFEIEGEEHEVPIEG